MKKKTFIFVNGIMTNPEDVEAWTDRAEAWVEANLQIPAEKMEYRAGVITRRFFQNERVKNLEKIVKRLDRNRLVLVGHSNGCDIIERFVKRGLFRCIEVHLIAGASERDFTKTWNDALRANMVGDLYVYTSPNDSALKKATWSRRLFGWLGLGYGNLGLTGPENVADEVKDRVHIIKKNWDHSDWFLPENFDETMKTIVNEK